MRRHAKASSAGSTPGIGSSRGLFGRAFATRGVSSGANGSGAPSGRRAAPIATTLAIAVLVLAFGAATASAKSVSNFFGASFSGASAGFFNTPRGVAVNNTSGDLYVVDSTNNRVVRLDASGNFISAFGQDVVESGADNAGTGFEICKASASPADVCKAGITTAATGGAMSAPQGIAIDQATGNLYVTDQGFLRVDEFSSAGSFIRAFGQDVVNTGPGNSPAQSAVQTLTVTATGGKFTLSFQGQTTGEIEYNASAASVQTALQALSTIGSGNATVTNAVPGTYVITFASALANNFEPTITAASAGGEPLTGGTASVASTTVGASGFEVCVAANSDVCQTGVSGATKGAFATTFAGHPAIAPAGAANVGNVLVADPGNRRMQEFSSAGTFVRAFGFDVAKAGPGNTGVGFEICSASNFDVCQVAAASGSGTGQFGTGGPLRVAEDSSGVIYTVESAAPNFRVQRFTPAGPALTPDASTFAAANGTSATDTPTDVAVNPISGNVFVTKAFAAGATPSCPATGVASVAERRVLEFGSGGTLQFTHMACAAINSANGLAFNPGNGRLFVSSAAPGHGVFVLDNVNPPTATINPVSLTGPASATFSGKVNPQGSPTGYRFEYSSDGGSSWTKGSLLEVGSGSSNVNVSGSFGGLLPSTAYLVRLAAIKPYGAGTATTAPIGFTTGALAPVVSLGSTVPSDTSLTAATLSGTVNPEGQATTYRFEYGKTTSYGTAVPAVAASAGSGAADVQVSQAISGLELNTTYHYRLVATNAAGTTNGDDLTFDTGPNLGNGMHYEMVGPVQVNGSETSVAHFSPDGNSVDLGVGKSGFGDTESQHAFNDAYTAFRTPTGWVTKSRNPSSPPDLVYGQRFDSSPDLDRYLFATSTKDEFNNGIEEWYINALNKTGLPTYPLLQDLSGTVKGEVNRLYAGASDDFTHILIIPQAPQSYVAGDPPISGGGIGQHLNEVVSDPPVIRNVAVDNSGSLIAPTCGVSGAAGYPPPGYMSVEGRGTNLISADGSKIFFNAKPGLGVTCGSTPPRVYARINGSQTIEISRSECTRADCLATTTGSYYTAASNDGSSVLLITSDQLSNEDLDATTDLYRYDFSKPAGHRLSLVSLGDSSDATPGSGARVQGFLQMSQDGSRMYYVAQGVLTTARNSFGAVAGDGANNLYVYEPLTGTTRFIARLDAGDVRLWNAYGPTELSPGSGRFLLFAAVTKIAPNDTNASSDVYRYDAQTGQMLRITPASSASNVTVEGTTDIGYVQPAALQMSADGSTIGFVTSDPLQANDANGATDVYLWHNGSVSLISSATGGTPPVAAIGGFVSLSGNEVSIKTSAHLVPEDVDTTQSAYVARTGPDVEHVVTPPQVPCESNDSCRGAAGQAPAGVTPATPTYVGPPNEATPKPKQKKKQHKKKPHKKKQQQKKHRAGKSATRSAR